MQDPTLNLVLGFVLGFIASLFASVALDRWTRPRLSIVVDEGIARGQLPGNPAHAFFHVVVSNRRDAPDDEMRPGLRPAWACTATLEVVLPQQTMGPIPARWTTQPEPILAVGVGATLVQIPDVARMLAGRRVDVHSHADQQLSVLVKFEGEDDCFLFTNESYAFPRWSNPAWRLGVGRHHLRVTVYYELGSKRQDFWIENRGSRRDDVELVARPD